MRLLFSEQAWEDYLFWQAHDAKTLERLNTLIRDTSRNPFQGIGKPEPRANAKRLLQGNHTGLADPHGIGVDPQRKLLYVTNHGSFRELNRSKGDITQTGMYQGTYSAAEIGRAHV